MRQESSDHPKGGILIKVGLGVYNVFQQYWEGQGDPLYAVLSRRGHGAHIPEYLASKEEVERLIDVATEIAALKPGDPMYDTKTYLHKRVAKALMKQLIPKLRGGLHHGKPQESLEEGQSAFGAHWYNATAKRYHGVNNFDGPLESIGPNLVNDRRLLERHVQSLYNGRPSDAVVTDLLERSVKATAKKQRSYLDRLERPTHIKRRKSLERHTPLR